MEYKRFNEYYLNENTDVFHTYLPIQLDATCNGFQHMALLSDEDTLFKELNLAYKPISKSNAIEISENKPSDFYNFLLHKLVVLFTSKVENGVFEEEDKMKGDKKKKYEYTQECGSIAEYVSKVVVVKKGLKRIKGTIKVKIKGSYLRLSKFL